MLLACGGSARSRCCKVLLDPLNSSMTTTMANLDTLGSLISAYFTVADDAWRGRFLKAAMPPSGVTPKNTPEDMAAAHALTSKPEPVPIQPRSIDNEHTS